MDRSRIYNALTESFGIRLDVEFLKYPDRIEIVSKPKDFDKRKGFKVRSKSKWLSLETHLEFDSYSGSLLRSIMKDHQDKIRVMLDTLNQFLSKKYSKNLYGVIDGVDITRSEDHIDLTKLSLHVENPTINLDVQILEDYIIEQQKLIFGIVLLLFDLEADPVVNEPEITGYPEGAKSTVEVNKYERSRLNRQACLNFYGYSCQVCGLLFEKRYGDFGKGFIHVHHLVPVSDIGENYCLNPISDLVPLCPNCHAMVHLRKPPLSIQELKNLILR